jgi:hypothetical protein
MQSFPHGLPTHVADPKHGPQQVSFFNGAYGRHVGLLERRTGCLLAARLRPGTGSSHSRIV